MASRPGTLLSSNFCNEKLSSRVLTIELEICAETWYNFTLVCCCYTLKFVTKLYLAVQAHFRYLVKFTSPASLCLIFML